MAKHRIFRITSFEIVAPFTLSISFDDGVQRTIDFRPIMHGEMFGPLRDGAMFNRVVLDPDAHTLRWPTGADFDPVTLHDWPELADAFIALAEGWKSDAAA